MPGGFKCARSFVWHVRQLLGKSLKFIDMLPVLIFFRCPCSTFKWIVWPGKHTAEGNQLGLSSLGLTAGPASVPTLVLSQHLLHLGPIVATYSVRAWPAGQGASHISHHTCHTSFCGPQCPVHNVYIVQLFPPKYTPVLTTGFWHFMPLFRSKYMGILLYPCSWYSGIFTAGPSDWTMYTLCTGQHSCNVSLYSSSDPM